MDSKIELLALVSVVVLSSACDRHSCTEMACNDEFSVTVTAAGGRFSYGDYQVDLILANGELADLCSFSVSDQIKGCGRCPTKGACNAIYHIGYDEEDWVSITYGFINEQDLTLDVYLDGTLILTDTLFPEYETVQPNGPGSDPICQVDEYTATISFD